MFKNNKAFSSFSINDLQKAKEFYSETLGLNVTENKEMKGLLNLHIKDGESIMLYTKAEPSARQHLQFLNFLVKEC